MPLDYILRDSAVYPPMGWTSVNSRISEHAETSTNALWNEMTERHDQMMASKHNLIASNALAKTVRLRWRNDPSLSGRIQMDRDADHSTDMEPDVYGMIKTARRHRNAVNRLKVKGLETIEEETRRTLKPTTDDHEQLCYALKQLGQYTRLIATDLIEPEFRQDLYQTIERYEMFVRSPVSSSDRPLFEDLRSADERVKLHLILAKDRLDSDVSKLRNFIDSILSDEYCMMRKTPEERKDSQWMQYGTYLNWNRKTGRERDAVMRELADDLQIRHIEDLRDALGERLERMISASGLDETDVKDRIIEYAMTDNEHIGKWQTYVKDLRWRDLAAKICRDWEQAEACRFETSIADSRSSQQTISNIQNTATKYFRKMRGPNDYKLSRSAKALVKERRKLEDKMERSTSSSSSERSSSGSRRSLIARLTRRLT